MLLGNGDGTFQPQVTYAVGIGPRRASWRGTSPATAASTWPSPTQTDNTVSVLLGNGDGTFQPQVTYAVGADPDAIVAGDFNGDGHLDLAVATTAPTTCLGAAGQRRRHVPAPGHATRSGRARLRIVAGDFTGDGHARPGRRQQLYTGAPGAVSVLLGTGDGTFADAGQFATTPYATPLVADVNGDGTDDVLVVDGSGNILYRQGDPRPARLASCRPSRSTPDNPSRDIAWLPNTNQGPVLASVDAQDDAISFYAYRDGRFVRLDGSLTTGQLPAQIIAAQLDGDGLTDLVVRNAGDGTVSVYFGSHVEQYRVHRSRELARCPEFPGARDASRRNRRLRRPGRRYHAEAARSTSLSPTS